MGTKRPATLWSARRGVPAPSGAGRATSERSREAAGPPLPATAYREGDWTVEQSVDRRADIEVGDHVVVFVRESAREGVMANL